MRYNKGKCFHSKEYYDIYDQALQDRDRPGSNIECIWTVFIRFSRLQNERKYLDNFLCILVKANKMSTCDHIEATTEDKGEQCDQHKQPAEDEREGHSSQEEVCTVFLCRGTPYHTWNGKQKNM